MNRRSPLILLFLLIATVCAVPVVANAAVTELSPIGEAKASCPGFEPKQCGIIVVRQTGFQAKVGTAKAFSTAKTNGDVVAWTVSLAGYSASDVKAVSANYGGTPKVALVVLQPLGKSTFRVVQKGPLVDVTKYLGTTPTFALPEALPIKRGQVIGISVPTWAPVLQIGMGGDTSWRSSRPLKESVAKDFSKQRSLVGDAVEAPFQALYQRARLVYSATVVPTPALAPVEKAPKATTPKKKTTS